jgi:hypothetical protein
VEAEEAANKNNNEDDEQQQEVNSIITALTAERVSNTYLSGKKDKNLRPAE